MDTAGENSKMTPQLPQFPDDLQPLKAGQKVEIMTRRRSSGFGDSWFPATVCTILDEQNYGVILSEEEGQGKMPKIYRVSRDKIRPADVEHFSPETELEPRATVEAFCLGAWSKGEVVCCVDNSDKYLVKIGSKKRRATLQPEMKELKDLRPLSHKRQYELGRQSGKGPCSQNEMTSSNDPASHDPKSWAVMKSHRALQQTLEPGHSTSIDDEAIQTATDDKEEDTYPTDAFQRKTNDSDNVGVHLDKNNFSELTRKRQYELGRQSGKGPSQNEMTSSNDRANHDPKSWAIIKSHRALQQPLEPRHSTPIDDEAIQTATDDQGGDTYPTDAFQRKSNDSDNVGVQLDENTSKQLTGKVSRRTNNGSSRNLVTHLKRHILRIKAGSKNPCNQLCSLDDTVVQEESFEQRNIIPSKLKGNLEYAQSCHNKMAEVMSVYNKYLEEENAAEAKELEKTTSLSQMQSLLDENREAIAELEQKLGHLRLKEQKIEKDMEQEQLELERAKEVRRGSGKVRYDYEQLFCRFMGEMQQMHNA